ncbi:Ig-like domain-containing protein [Paenibacillus sp. HB172176]|uniref:OmpL47-type beta-barrel domain-containing protein n=1 Tax=Paenibacillus sp. HB172176 TaxID=2493690 RepID=UPI001439688E|nr:Ig-like domain-containing protein [Paenibacillus sp. HB172176]
MLNRYRGGLHIRFLVMLGVAVACLMMGWTQQADAAVMEEQLPASADLPEQLSGVAASRVFTGNQALVTGGQTNSNGFAAHSYIFNADNQTWSSFAPPLQLSYHHQSILNDGRVLVTGGNQFISGIGYVYNNSSSIYSMLYNTWTSAANLPVTMLGNSQSTLLDGRVMIVGGSDEIYSASTSATYDKAYLYDPGTNAWSEAASLPVPVYGAAQSTLNDGRVLLTGGQSGYALLHHSYLYDPVANAWTKAADLPYEGSDVFFRHAQVTLGNGKVLVMGNCNYYLYDPASNSWTMDSVNSGHLENASMVVFGNNVYVFGGYNDQTYEMNRHVFKLSFDFNAPSAPTLSGVPAGWTALSASIGIAPGTDAETGVDRTEYSLSGASTLGWTLYNSGDVISITSSGQTTISARTIDKAGNISSLATGVIKIDQTPPTAPAINRSSSSWSPSAVSFSLGSSSDGGGSGVSRMEYSLSGAKTQGWTTYSSAVSVTAWGQTTVHARSVDGVGNVSSESAAVILIDSEAPAAPTVTIGAVGWSAANVSVSVDDGSDTGGSGISRSEIRLSGAVNMSWTTYSGTITVNAEGTTEIEARTVDNAGNISELASAQVRIDKTAPTAPVVTPSETTWTNSESVDVAITGGADGGSGVNRVEYSLSGATTKSWTAYSDALTITAEGETTISARAIDNVGNVSGVATGLVKIDRASPGDPVISPASGGWSASAVQVTVAPAADSGGSGVNRVEYKLSGAMTRNWTTYSAELTISAEGETTIEARAIDNAGNISGIAVAAERIDVSKPDKPSISGGSEEWQTAESVALTADSGADSGGSGVNRVEYRLSGAQSSPWTSYSGPIAVTTEGITTIAARVVDNAGNSSDEETTMVKLDYTAPTVPGVHASAAEWTSADVNVTLTPGTDAVSGLNATEYRLSGAMTSDWTPYSGALAITAEGETVVFARSGDAAGNWSEEASATVRIDRTEPTAPALSPETTAWTNAASVAVSVIAGSDGEGSGSQLTEYSLSGATVAGWTSYSSPIALMAAGQTTIKARTIDAAGNVSDEASAIVLIDRTPPAAPVIERDAESWTSAAAVSVVIASGGDEGGSGASYTEYRVSGAEEADWSLYEGEISLTAEGESVISAREIDGAGNVGEIAQAAIRIDRTPPSQPVVTSPGDGSFLNDSKPVMEGTADGESAVLLVLNGAELPPIIAEAGGAWSYTPSSALPDGEYALKVSAEDAAGNVSEIAVVSFEIDTAAPAAPMIETPLHDAFLNNAAPIISGTGEPGAAITLYLDDEAIDESIAVEASGDWSYSIADPLADGVHETKAEATDAAGNVSAASTVVVWTQDTAAPEAPVISSPADGASLNGNRPLINGTAEAGSFVTLMINGAEQATIEANVGNWSYAMESDLADGMYVVKAFAADRAGNVGEDSETISIEIDTIAPAAPIIEAPQDAAILNTNKPELSGYGEAGAAIDVILDGGSLAHVTTNEEGEWSLEIDVALTEGAHTVKAVARDAAGNESEESASLTFKVDTVKPPVPVVTEPGNGATINLTKPVLSGKAEAGSRVVLDMDDRASEMLEADDEGIWSFTVTDALELGEHRVRVRAIDAAGNESESSTEHIFTVVSDNAALAQLELSDIKLKEAVDRDTLVYSANTFYGRTSTTITAIPEDPNATVQLQMDGMPVENPVDLKTGNQTITILITAQDGMTVQAYKVNIYKVPYVIIPDKPEEPEETKDSEGLDALPPLKICEGNGAAGGRYTDTAGHWAEEAVRKASGCGVVNGYEDGSFHPDAVITRAQFVVMLIQALEEAEGDSGDDSDSGGSAALSESAGSEGADANGDADAAGSGDADLSGEASGSGENVAEDGASQSGGGEQTVSFADEAAIPDWAANAVAEAVRYDLVNGYEDGTFRPDAFVTRAEMVTLIAKIAKLAPLDGDAVDGAFADADAIPDWAKGYAAAARQAGFVNGRGDGRFDPLASSTRAEAVTMLLRIMEAQKDEQLEANAADEAK